MVLLEVYQTHLTQRVVSQTCTDDLTTVVVNIVRREASWPLQRCSTVPECYSVRGVRASAIS
jgi:hypothetical protein